MRALAVVVLMLALGCTPAAVPSTRIAPTATPVRPSQPSAETSAPQPSNPPASPIAAVAPIIESRSDAPRNPLSAATEEQLAELVAADTSFAFRLYHELVRSEPGNAFLSPYSISTAFSMVVPGARGRTAEEVAVVLGVGSDEPAWHAARNRLELELLAAAEFDYPGEGDVLPMTLEPTNAILGQAGYPFNAPYLDTLARNYGAGMHAVDFMAHPEPSRLAINEWVAQRTRDRIEELLPRGTITDMTRFVLVNAIYFRANWARQFAPESTYPEVFRLLDGTTIETPMMHSGWKNQYASGEGWEAIQLPYWGDASMLVIVPEPGRFSEVEARLDRDLLAGVRDGLEERQVTLSLPKWESASSFDLIPAMRALGVRDLFEPFEADLTGIADVEQMFIAHALHQANITVDEEGTEAAAATAIVGEAVSAATPVTLKVDRPFIYLIQNESTGEILFMGRVVDPSPR